MWLACLLSRDFRLMMCDIYLGAVLLLCSRVWACVTRTLLAKAWEESGSVKASCLVKDGSRHTSQGRGEGKQERSLMTRR